MAITDDDVVSDLLNAMVEHVDTYMTPRDSCFCHGFNCDDTPESRCPEPPFNSNNTPIMALISARQEYLDGFMSVNARVTTQEMYDGPEDVYNQWLTEINNCALIFRIPGLPPHLEPDVPALQRIMLENRYDHFMHYANFFGWDYVYSERGIYS